MSDDEYYLKDLQAKKLAIEISLRNSTELLRILIEKPESDEDFHKFKMEKLQSMIENENIRLEKLMNDHPEIFL